MWHVIFTEQAAKDAKKLKAAGLDGKAKRLIEVVRVNPFGTPPAYEDLVGSLAGLYSRRINLQHRFVYSVDATPAEHAGTRNEGTGKGVRLWPH